MSENSKESQASPQHVIEWKKEEKKVHRELCKGWESKAKGMKGALEGEEGRRESGNKEGREMESISVREQGEEWRAESGTNSNEMNEEEKKRLGQSDDLMVFT